jgi:hypothetical protein
MDVALRPDGAVCIADNTDQRVSCYSSNGKLLFHSGRKGQGPGEFQLPYRLAALPDNSLAVFDLAGRSISLLDPKGRFVRRIRVPFGFSQVAGMLGLSPQLVAVSGYAPTAGEVSDSAVHLLALDSATARHVGSFAPVPRADDLRALQYWGTGQLSRSRDGGIIYSQRIPYELHFFDPHGVARRVLPVSLPVASRADEAVSVTRERSRTNVRMTDIVVVAPGTAIPVNDTLLLVPRFAHRTGKPESAWWDCISLTTGKVLGSVALPTTFRILDLAGVVDSGRALLGVALVEEAAVLVKITFRVK